MIMFLVRKGDVRIRKVEVLFATPRWVTLPGNFGGRRERIVSMYHRYHMTFVMAKYWLRCDLERARGITKVAYDKAVKAVEALDALTESDI